MISKIPFAKTAETLAAGIPIIPHTKAHPVKNVSFWFGLLFSTLVLGGCGAQKTSNIVDGADDEKMAAYEKALADADAMSEGYEGTK